MNFQLCFFFTLLFTDSGINNTAQIRYNLS